MLSPEQDVEDRSPVWDCLQMFWMDADPAQEIDLIAKCCARSKYSLSELDAIYWNEIFPAVGFNLRIGNVVPEWAGFSQDWLSQRVLEKHRFGKRKPLTFLHPYALYWSVQLTGQVRALRERADA